MRAIEIAGFGGPEVLRPVVRPRPVAGAGQLGKAFGDRVIATAGSDDKCARCIELGADHAVNYRTQDFSARALELTGGRGVDVVLDMVAGDYIAREIACLAEDGRIVLIA